MENSEIYNVVKSLVGFKENDNSTSARTLISTLLPIDYASGYYLSIKQNFMIQCKIKYFIVTINMTMNLTITGDILL